MVEIVEPVNLSQFMESGTTDGFLGGQISTCVWQFSTCIDSRLESMSFRTMKADRKTAFSICMV
jgi:hypothetical protein